MFVQADDTHLVIELSVERQADGLKKQARVLIVRSVGMYGDMHTWNHLRRVA